MSRSDDDAEHDNPLPADRATSRTVQLRDQDSVFLSVDSREAPSCIAGLTIVEAADCPDFSFAGYLEILRERVRLIDRFGWKLHQIPFGLDNAYWVEADRFDPATHVRRVSVRPPGDRRALAELVGVLHAMPLDRRRPLWECWWIEGLQDGRVATLLKFHHCLMDGQSGMGLAEILMDLSPEPRATPSPRPGDETDAPAPPRLPELARRAVRNAARRPERIAAHAGRAVRDGLDRLLGTREAPPAPTVPDTPWNARLTGRRAFAYTSLPLEPIRDARKHFDVKLNDVLLELLADAVRRVLIEDDRLPNEPIVAICPVSLRADDETGFDNRLSSMPVAMATDRADPVDRLLAIHRSADEAKHRLNDGAFEMMGALADCFVPGALQVASQAAHALSRFVPLPGNLVFSNVRGIGVPLYLAGARVAEIYPMSMLQVATGMNVTAVSHDDQVDFGFLVDGALVPDPWRYADALKDALDDLTSAIESRLGARAAHAFAPRSSPLRTTGMPRGARRAAPGPETEPLDLMLLISGLSHVRAPSRGPIGTPVDESPDGATPAPGERPAP